MDESNGWEIAGNWAEVYDACFIPAMIATWVLRLVALAMPQPSQRVLDVACGSGVVASYAALAVGPAGRVAGLDISPEMLAIARRKTGQNGIYVSPYPSLVIETKRRHTTAYSSEVSDNGDLCHQVGYSPR